jgi:hypothetical protein
MAAEYGRRCAVRDTKMLSKFLVHTLDGPQQGGLQDRPQEAVARDNREG